MSPTSLFRLAVAGVSVTLLAACNTPPHAPSAVFTATDTPVDFMQGVWFSSEKDWILEVTETGMYRWQDTGDYCYLTPSADDSTPLMGQVEYRLFTPGRDGQSVRLQYLPGDASAHFGRLSGLPSRCVTDQSFTQSEIFEIFASTMADHYAFFDTRGVDWNASVDAAWEQISDAMSDAELWAIFESLLLPLGDSHTKMVGMVDGQKQRIQGGLGHTLPFIRETLTESVWIPELVDTLQADILDPGSELIADRVIVGEIDGRIGYIQLFTMGGFTNDHPPGSIEWSEAEIASLHKIFDDALTKFNGHDAIILDLSNNRGGYDAITRAIASRFTDVAFTGYRVSVPGHEEADMAYTIQPYSGPLFTGPIYVLTSDVTVSGGEITTMMMKQIDSVTHVGGKTRGAFSTPLSKPLPNGWYLELSNEVFANAQDERFEGHGIPPDIELDVYPETAPVAGHGQAIREIVALHASTH